MENKFKDTIKGNHITLRKVEIADAADIFRWRSSVSGTFLRQPEGYSVKMQEDWIRSRSGDEVNYIIINNKTTEKVGTIGIYDVNEANKTANIGRLLLDDVYLTKSNPFGLEALLLTYNYLFSQMSFDKVVGDILAKNAAMYKLQKYLGMQEDDYLEKHTLIKGNLEDLYIMSITKEQFEKSYRPKINFLLQGFK